MIKRTLVLMMSVALCASVTQGAITETGVVSPATPLWNSATNAYIYTGTVTVDDGSDIESNLSSVGATGVGSMTVTDPGSTWTPHHHARMGYYANSKGTLNITNGGAVNGTHISLGLYGGAKGWCNITDPGSILTGTRLSVGHNGDGWLDVSSGGVVSTSHGRVGDQSGSTGDATIRGVGSKWTNTGEFDVGYFGNGALDIIRGGLVSNTNGYVGRTGSRRGKVIVRDTGSEWTSSGGLNVGHSGHGELEVRMGGEVSNTSSGMIGFYDGSSGKATVRGAGSTWTNSSVLRVGLRGAGRLQIFDDGLVSVARELTIDYTGPVDSRIAMANGGMLALNDGAAGDDLADFLSMVAGTGSIRYFNGAAWDDITNATAGVDYTVAYQSGGDLDGYTVLTVTAAPEPATMALLAIGGLAMLRRRRR
jgi:T5SS/PEP-CTERM-associated repeat protein